MREHLASIFGAWTKHIGICVRTAQDAGAPRNDIGADTIANFIANTWEGAVLRDSDDGRAYRRHGRQPNKAFFKLELSNFFNRFRCSLPDIP